MTYDTLDKDGNVKTLPLFTDINIRTQRYTFSHPSSLLFATQFAQIALVVTEKAAFNDMRSKYDLSYRKVLKFIARSAVATARMYCSLLTSHFALLDPEIWICLGKII